ncbi:MAG: Crp/Fnr family transcriptional regulator [Burkholderiales bacterium]
MSMLTNLDLIRRVPLFSSLSDRHAETIAQAVVKKRFKRGEMIVEQGKKSNALFIILAGRARVMTTDRRGREVILATLSQGACIGEMSLIDNKPHSATVQADVQTDALVLSRPDFAACMPEYSSLAHSVLQGVVTRLREADAKIESLALMDVYGRVARALVEAAQPDRDGNLVIRERISRQDVAKMVGASREMVSRVMKDLEGRGFVELQPNGSTIIKERLNTLT